MAYGVVNAARVAAQNLDVYNRTAQATVDVAGGGLVALAHSGARGNDVYTATVPVTGGLTGLWMALNPGQKTIADVNGNVYNGLSRDPRAYTNLANSPFGAIKVHKDDFIEITSDGVVSTDVASVVAGDYLNAVNAKTILGRTAAASGIPANTTTFVVNYVGYATFPPVKGSVGMTQQKVFGLTCVQE
jgi:hypothetical protein